MIEAIVFDMDGILFDTERLSVESWVEVAGKMGLGDIDKGVYGCIGSVSYTHLTLPTTP